MPLTAAQITAALPRTALTRIECLPWPKIGSGKVRHQQLAVECR